MRLLGRPTREADCTRPSVPARSSRRLSETLQPRQNSVMVFAMCRCWSYTTTPPGSCQAGKALFFSDAMRVIYPPYGAKRTSSLFPLPSTARPYGVGRRCGGNRRLAGRCGHRPLRRSAGWCNRSVGVDAFIGPNPPQAGPFAAAARAARAGQRSGAGPLAEVPGRRVGFDYVPC